MYFYEVKVKEIEDRNFKIFPPWIVFISLNVVKIESKRIWE